MSINDDILLIRLIQHGDEKAFNYIFDTYFVPMCRLGYIYLNNQEEAEEAALDIFIHLWEKRMELNIQISLKSYLFQSVRNRCLNVIRDKKRTCSLEDIGELKQEEYPFLEMEELNRLIEEAVLALPEKCREIFSKSREQQQTYQEIATEMNISIKTVEAQISKALKRIKEYLGNKYLFLF
ncbi:RNA polymerase sigma-70 factor [Phocaeicola sp.]